MTKEWFLEHYLKLLSLQSVLGEMPEVEELKAEARADGLDVDKLIAEQSSIPEVLLWS